MGHRIAKSYCLRLCKETYASCTGNDFVPEHCSDLHDGCMTACMSQTEMKGGPRYPVLEDDF